MASKTSQVYGFDVGGKRGTNFHANPVIFVTYEGLTRGAYFL